MSEAVKIGEMNKQVQFKMPVKKRNETGEQIKEWVTSNAVWAKVTFKKSENEEKNYSEKKTDIATVVFAMYFNEATRPTWRILHGNDEYEILNVLTQPDSMFMEVEARRYEDK